MLHEVGLLDGQAIQLPKTCEVRPKEPVFRRNLVSCGCGPDALLDLVKGVGICAFEAHTETGRSVPQVYSTDGAKCIRKESGDVSCGDATW